MTTNFEKFVEFNDVLQDWKRLRDERDAEQVCLFWSRSSHLLSPAMIITMRAVEVIVMFFSFPITIYFYIGLPWKVFESWKFYIELPLKEPIPNFRVKCFRTRQMSLMRGTRCLCQIWFGWLPFNIPTATISFKIFSTFLSFRLWQTFQSCQVVQMLQLLVIQQAEDEHEHHERHERQEHEHDHDLVNVHPTSNIYVRASALVEKNLFLTNFWRSIQCGQSRMKTKESSKKSHWHCLQKILRLDANCNVSNVFIFVKKCSTNMSLFLNVSPIVETFKCHVTFF